MRSYHTCIHVLYVGCSIERYLRIRVYRIAEVDLMTTLTVETGRYGELVVRKSQAAKVFGETRIQEHELLIPRNAMREFKKQQKSKRYKTQKIKLAFLLLGKYETAITKHGTRALIETVGTHATDALISLAAKQHGLWPERMHGTVVYQGRLV